MCRSPLNDLKFLPAELAAKLGERVFRVLQKSGKAERPDGRSGEKDKGDNSREEDDDTSGAERQVDDEDRTERESATKDAIAAYGAREMVHLREVLASRLQQASSFKALLEGSGGPRKGKGGGKKLAEPVVTNRN